MDQEPTYSSQPAHFRAAGSGPHAGGRDYIAYLENSLQFHKDSLAKSQAALAAIQASPAWNVVNRCRRLRNRLLPAMSRRGRAARGLLGATIRFIRLVRSALRKAPPPTSDADALYQAWIRKNTPTPEELERQRCESFPGKLKISIVTPTYETPPALLTALLESLRAQTYGEWELCVADGGSRSPEVRAILEEAARWDPRVKVTFLPNNEGIAGNTAAALALASGDYVTFVDHDDLLPPFALFEVARALRDEPAADLLYSDEDKIDAAGLHRREPHFKPDWSPDLLMSHNYICHLAVYRRELLERVGGPRPGFDGAQDYDLILRASEQARKIVHVPKVLYHWRVHRGSTAGEAAAKPYAYEAGCRALQESLRRRGIVGDVTLAPTLGAYRTSYRLAGKPLVSIIIPNHDQAAILARCLDSVARSTYEPYEILLVENHSREAKTFAYYERLRGRPGVRLLTWDRPFNYAAVNNYAAAQARGEVLLFLNNDVEVINADWLERMLEHALRPEIGSVGAKLYYPDDRVQHAGVVVGMGGVAGHPHLYFPRENPGYCFRLVSVQNYSAVTGACLMMRKRVFEEIGAFDEGFILAFNDVDLCVRVGRAGYRILWTPWAELYHHESATRGSEDTPAKQARFLDEVRRFHTKWGDRLRAGDPYYNPNLTLDRQDFSPRA